MADYSKYKERKPEETVFKIRSILHQMGLFPVISWGPDSYKGARYNRVELYPTTQGTNGKGTDELYCSASGLAEMIERLSNGILPVRDRQDDLFDEVGFHEFPDEKMMTIHEVLDNPDPLTEYILPKMGCDNYFSQYTFLKTIAAYSKTGDQLVTVPFADPANNTVVYIPLLLLVKVHGSNGMAAGNTLDEAMVQGLSEIFERAVSRKLILGESVPPVIPDEVLKQYSFYSLIEQVRTEGPYRVTVYDCSLGRGWPVAGVLISNLETGNFGMKLGAHPSFAVACERTLTEALQGRNLEMFTSVCTMGSDEAAAHYNNYTNICKVGVGIYPASLFDRTPDWEFKPWTQWEGLDNRGFLEGMIRLLTEEGFRPLFRDVSFLGFPGCYIAVPGLSDIYPLGSIHARAMNSQVQTLSAWGQFPDLSEEEEKRLLRLIRFKKNVAIENQISFFSQRPLSDNYSLDKIAAWLSVKYGKYATAKKFFQRYSYTLNDREETVYLAAMIRYCELREMGMTTESANRVIGQFFCEAAAERVLKDTADESRVMQEQFQKLSCFDCGHCPAAGTDCDYPNVRMIAIRNMKAMKAGSVSQEKLLRRLTPVFEPRK